MALHAQMLCNDVHNVIVIFLGPCISYQTQQVGFDKSKSGSGVSHEHLNELKLHHRHSLFCQLHFMECLLSHKCPEGPVQTGYAHFAECIIMCLCNLRRT